MNYFRRILNSGKKMSDYNDDKGIEGRDNSCYLDSTLFSMFAKTRIFDPIFFGSPNNNKNVDKDKTISKIKGILREIVENNLRQGFCPSSKVQALRSVLSQFNPRMVSCQLDVDDLIATLFGRALKLNPFIHYCEGTSNFLHQLFLIPDSYYPHDTSIDVQTCLEMSMSSQCLTLASVPSPALFIKMPRSNGRLIGFDYIIPNLILDINSVMGTVSESMREKCKLHLMAVICLSHHHYTTYVRQGQEISSPWIYFDSMPPRVTPVPYLGKELDGLAQNYYRGHQNFFDVDMSNNALSVLSNIHVCIYEPMVSINNQSGDGGTMKRDRNDEMESMVTESKTKRSRRHKNKQFPELPATIDDVDPTKFPKNYEDDTVPKVESDFVKLKQKEKRSISSYFEFFWPKAPSSSSTTSGPRPVPAETQTSGQLVDADADLDTEEKKDRVPQNLQKKVDEVNNLVDFESQMDSSSIFEGQPMRTSARIWETLKPTLVIPMVHSSWKRSEVRNSGSGGHHRSDHEESEKFFIPHDKKYSAVSISALTWPPPPSPPPSFAAADDEEVNFIKDVAICSKKQLDDDNDSNRNFSMTIKTETVEEIFLSKEQEVEKGCPCGLESLIFTLFHTTLFDNRLFLQKRDEEDISKSVFSLLKTASKEIRLTPWSWRNSTKDIVREVRGHLKKFDRESIEDVDTLIPVIFSKLKRVGPFIQYTKGEMNSGFFHIIKIDTDQSSIMEEPQKFADLQFLLMKSMRGSQFQRTPDPALIIKIIKQGRNGKKIVPNLVLDITSLTDVRPPLGNHMDLYAVICLYEKKHYTTFVKKSNFEWLFFDPRESESVVVLDNEFSGELKTLEKFACSKGMKTLSPKISHLVSNIDFAIYLTQPNVDDVELMSTLV